jgi:hypothetical protein
VMLPLWLAVVEQAIESGAAPESGLDYQGLTAGGWITMILSVGFVVGLLTWCVWKVISTPGAAEHLHAQADIETPDLRD